jgi:hypothetical protein
MPTPPRRFLTVEPTGGLANRMRVVDSAASLAEERGLALTVHWTRTSDLNARFAELFEPLPGVRVREHAWTTSRLWRVSARLLGYYRPYVDQAGLERRMKSGVGVGDLAVGPRAFLITCSRFVAVPGPARRWVPVRDLRHELDRVTRAFDSATLGIHIRRRDFPEGRESPTEGFMTWMKAELRQNPATRFFLATDSLAEERTLAEAFPGRLITRPKNYDRNRPEGVRDALIDLYALARTRRIAGTHSSSFSEVAGEIGGCEVVTIGGPQAA